MSLPKRKILCLIPLMGALSACSSVAMQDAIDRSETQRSHYNQRHQNDYRARLHDSQRQMGQDVNRPWIVGKAQPLARDASLPPVLQSRVNTTMLFSEGPTDLIGLADRIQMATGVLVQVKSDALLPLQEFLPRIDAKDITLVKQPDVADTLVPSISLFLNDGDRTSGPALSPAQQQRLNNIQLGNSGSAPLSRVLDAISLRLGVYWKYEPTVAAIVFYRTETRTFTVRLQDFEYESNLDLGLSGDGGGSSNSGGGQFKSTSRTNFTLESDANPHEDMMRKIRQFMTRAGKIESSGGASNTLVVTDTQDALNAIDAFLEKENKRVTRRVRLLFEEVSIQYENTSQFGIDWGAIYSSAGRATAGLAAGVSSMLDVSRGPFGMGASVGSGQWQGSSVSVEALSEIGKVLRRTSMPLLSLNRRPATYAVRESFRFIDEMEQTQSTSDANNPTVTAKQTEETVGTFLTVIPDAQDDGQVLLTLNYNDSRLISLTKEELGTHAFVQQPRISAQGMTQQVELRAGQTTLVAGFEQQNDDYTKRRLDEDVPMLLGGSNRGNQKSVLTLLFVTVIPEEGY